MMAFTIFILILLLIVVFTNCYNVRIVLMLPYDDPYLKPLAGYETTAGAVMLALDRIKEENLLPGANFSLILRNCQCREDATANQIMDILGRNLAHVIISSPCAQSAFISAVLSAKYNIPFLNWAVTTVEMTDGKRFQTSSRTIGSAFRIGKATVELLNHFGWHRVALFFTDDGMTRKCYSIAQGISMHLASMDIHNVFTLIVDGKEPTEIDIDRFLDALKQMARIAIICVDRGIKRVMLRAQEKGMTAEDYVYILPEYVHSENRSDIWTNFNNIDSRNGEERLAFNASLFIEMELSNEEILHSFRKRIPERMRMAPFYHVDQKADEHYGSLYSPFLHDSLYLYALALNKALASGSNIFDGRKIIQLSKDVRFQGVSGFISVDHSANRESTFVVKVLDKYNRMRSIAKLKTHYVTGDVPGKVENESWTEVQRVEMLVPESLLWETRGGFRPTGEPICGWLNDDCLGATRSVGQWIGIGTGGSLAFVGLVAALISYIVKKRILASDMSKMLWKISYKDLIQIKEQHEKGHASVNTLSTTSSEEGADITQKTSEQVVNYNGVLVWMRVHSGNLVMTSDKDHMELKMLRDINHENLNPFIGLCVDTMRPISLWLYCAKGSLDDVLLTTTVKLDWFFKYSLIKDLSAGLEYIHNCWLSSHGHLKSSNCLVDPRWVLRITDYGLPSLRAAHEVAIKDRLWTAPELLRMPAPPPQGTQKGDVYSFGIIVSEIITRDKPFAMFEDMTPEEIVSKVRRGDYPLLRPILRNINDADVDPHMVSLMNDCLVEEPERRPDAKEIRSAVRQMGRGKTTSLMDHVLKIMEQHAKNLESQVQDRTRQLTEEMKRSDMLLSKMLPSVIADRLKRGQEVEPEAFEAVTLFFSDIADFQLIAARCTPVQLIMFINDLYTMIDGIIEQYDAYKVETVNNCYLVVSGLPKQNGNKHASEIADMALQLQLSMSTFHVSCLPNEKIELRCGIHTGPVVAGVVGQIMSRYCLFGDTVNTASRVETNSKPSCIHISDVTNRYLTQIIGGYITKPRGEIVLKGKGIMTTFWLLGKKTKAIHDNTDGKETTPVIEIRDINQSQELKGWV